MPETRPPVDLDAISLGEIQRLVDERRLPPVHEWNPGHCGHSGMLIDREGRWFHQGRLIDRPAMVRLFSTVLRREPDGRHVLVTPAEKLDIDVEGTAFRALEMRCEGEGSARKLAFRLNTGDTALLDAEHPLRVIGTPEGPSPRLLVRDGLEAELARPIYYELAEIGIAENPDDPGVWSFGTFFPLSAAGD